MVFRETSSSLAIEGVLGAGEQVAREPDLLDGQRRGPPEAHAAGAGGVQAFMSAFDDELTNELGQGGEDMEHEPPAGGSGVQGLVQALEAHAAAAQISDQGDEVLQGAGEPVQAEDNEGVPRAQVVKGRVELFTLGGAAGLLLGEHPQAPGFLQGADLPVEDLSLARDPGVPDQGAGQDGGFGREAVDLVRGLHHVRNCTENGRLGLLSTSTC
jgi:hypothetical protein